MNATLLKKKITQLCCDGKNICSICNKEFYSYDLDNLEYVKNKRKEDKFYHKACIKEAYKI